jgi:hypothetical protein
MLIKRKKKEAESIHVEISNDISGFTNYFTAPNIRNKVKHPIFLAYKFSNCVSLYYNSDNFPGTEKVDVIVEQAVSVLLDHYRK